MERCQRCEERCIQVQNCRPRVLKNFPSFTCQNSLQQIRDWCPQITRWASSLMTAGRRTIVVTVRTLPFPCDPPISDWHGVIVWSNFEIGDLDFWRGEAYTKFVEFLDEKGGFYYEVRRQDRVFFWRAQNDISFNSVGETRPCTVSEPHCSRGKIKSTSSTRLDTSTIRLWCAYFAALRLRRSLMTVSALPSRRGSHERKVLVRSDKELR